MAIDDNMPGMSVNRKENHMLELRKKLSNYQEVFYLLFLLPMTGMSSMGLNSEDRIYLYVFAVATLFLLLKMAVTDFTWREILIMSVFAALLGANFLRNGEKTLILTAMGIFGAKNVNLDKVMKYALWEKAVLTVGTLTLAATGVIENERMLLPKNGEYFEIPCYGYYHPNMAFANIFMILLLAIIVYGDKLKWYAYVLGTMIMLGTYWVFMCRTGLVVWAVLCFMMLGYRIMSHIHWEKGYLYFFTAIPAVLMILTLVIPLEARKNAVLAEKIHTLLTGRIALINKVYDDVWGLVLGHIPVRSFDSMYFTTVYNYGWVLLILYLVAYTVGIRYSIRKGQYYIAIALGATAVYGYVELLPLSVIWNLPMIYLAQALFRERMVVHE